MKTEILMQSDTRAVSEDDMRAVTDSLLTQPGLIQEFLESPHAEIRQWTGEFVGHLTSYVSTVETGSAHLTPALQLHVRPQTRQSLYSILSESKSIGATISIHAVAKPLMCLMYHRQALSFIEKNSAAPLSAQITDTYLRYLTYKYVGASTKATILADLEKRAVLEDDADTTVNLFMQSDLLEILFNSPVPEVCTSTCRLLRRLDRHGSRPDFALVVIPYIASLLSDEDLNTVVGALEALPPFLDFCNARVSLDTALVKKLLQSPDSHILRGVCKLLTKLGLRDCIPVGISSSPPSESLVSLLRHLEATTVQCATDALTYCCLRSPDGVKTTINAGLIDILLDSSSLWITSHLRGLLERLARMPGNSCPILLSRLRDASCHQRAFIICPVHLGTVHERCTRCDECSDRRRHA
ncbi:hypothetical protein B0H19DRAFT_330695 [Mycena capillaripes]|nr:hypothetical protein B0H19DRAFT_330695 [Mycena capillaripes]